MSKFKQVGDRSFNMRHVTFVQNLSRQDPTPAVRCQVHLDSGEVVDLEGDDAERMLKLVHADNAKH